jgi:hypothetical protein
MPAIIKDILVNLNIGAKANSAGDYAISVAPALDAHLTGIAFLYDPIVPVSDAGWIPAEVIRPRSARTRRRRARRSTALPRRAGP